MTEAVRYWEKWGGEERQALEALIRAFNASQKEYEVVLEDIGDWSASTDLPRFLEAYEEGDVPDLVGLEDHQVVDLVQSGVLAPLDRDSGFWNRGGLRNPFRTLGAHGDWVYAVPLVADLVTLYVNLEAVEGTPFAGGSVPPRLDEFQRGLEVMRAEGTGGFVPTYPGWWPHAWPWFFEGGWFQGDRFAPVQRENVQGYEWVVSFREWAGPAFRAPVNPLRDPREDPFCTGRVAMVLEGDWIVQRLADLPELTWTTAPFPSTSGRPSALAVADVLAVPRRARNVEGALALLRFLLKPRNLEALALGQSKISPLRRWSDGFRERHPNPRLAELEAVLDFARVFHDPRMRGWLHRRDAIGRAFRRMWCEGEPPDRALAEIEKD